MQKMTSSLNLDLSIVLFVILWMMKTHATYVDTVAAACTCTQS